MRMWTCPDNLLSENAAAMAAAVEQVWENGDTSGLPITIDDHQEFLQRNKLSRELLPDRVTGSKQDAAHRHAREQRLSAVTEALSEANVSYASMKNLKTPYTMMSDIDLLVPDPREHSVAVRVLAEREYDFYRFRLLAHPRKTMAKQADDDPRPVDIYPDAIWMRKVVCDAASVVSYADSEPPRDPAAVDDLYLVATHAFSHLSITFAELFHGVAVLSEASSFDWDRLCSMACQFGCADALLSYLLPLDEYLAATDRQRIPSKVFDRLRDGFATRAVDRWWNSKEPPYTFPIQFPLMLPTVISAGHHVPQIMRQRSMYTAYKDLQSHALTVASKLIRGEA